MEDSMCKPCCYCRLEQVAMLSEIAPKRKAKSADSDAGDTPFSAVFCLFVGTRCFSGSKTVLNCRVGRRFAELNQGAATQD